MATSISDSTYRGYSRSIKLAMTTQKIPLLLALVLLSAIQTRAQELFSTREGYLSFLSETRIERIFAETNEAQSFLNVKTGEVAFSVNIESFRFRIKLMQEHFNEQYMESAKYPRATFSGKIENPEQLNPETPGVHTLMLRGKLTIRGVAQEVAAPVRLEVGNKQRITGSTEFILKPEDFRIKIPSVVGLKIAKEVVVSVKADYGRVQ